MPVRFCLTKGYDRTKGEWEETTYRTGRDPGFPPNKSGAGEKSSIIYDILEMISTWLAPLSLDRNQSTRLAKHDTARDWEGYIVH